jgi:hypothetical protein
MIYADTVGTKRILERVVTFHREHGERWKPAGLLARLAETGKASASMTQNAPCEVDTNVSFDETAALRAGGIPRRDF